MGTSTKTNWRRAGELVSGCNCARHQNTDAQVIEFGWA